MIFELNLLYIKGLYDSKCLLLEPLRWRGFRVGKKQGEKVGFFGEKGAGLLHLS